MQSSQTKPPPPRPAGIGALVKKLLIAVAIFATIAWIVGLIRLLAPMM